MEYLILRQPGICLFSKQAEIPAAFRLLYSCHPGSYLPSPYACLPTVLLFMCSVSNRERSMRRKRIVYTLGIETRKAGCGGCLYLRIGDLCCRIGQRLP